MLASQVKIAWLYKDPLFSFWAPIHLRCTRSQLVTLNDPLLSVARIAIIGRIEGMGYQLAEGDELEADRGEGYQMTEDDELKADGG